MATFKRSLTTYRALLRKFQSSGHLKEIEALAEEFLRFARGIYSLYWVTPFLDGEPEEDSQTLSPVDRAIAILDTDIQLMESVRASKPTKSDDKKPEGNKTSDGELLDLPGFDDDPETFSPDELILLVEGTRLNVGGEDEEDS